LSEHSIDRELPYSFNQTENSENEVHVQEGRQVAVGSVDPAEEEVVVAVGETFFLFEELLSLFHIEFLP
jgi:hypothetical protein